MEKNMEKIGVTIPAWLLERKIICYYLIIRDCCWNNREFSDVLAKAPEKQLYEMISTHMNAFMQQGRCLPQRLPRPS